MQNEQKKIIEADKLFSLVKEVKACRNSLMNNLFLEEGVSTMQLFNAHEKITNNANKILVEILAAVAQVYKVEHFELNYDKPPRTSCFINIMDMISSSGRQSVINQLIMNA